MSEQMGWCYACQEPRPRESLRLMRRDDGSLWESVWVCDMHGDEGGFDIDDTEARLIALDVVIVGIKTQHLPGWEEYPGLSQEAWGKVDGEVAALCNRMEDWQRQLADQHGRDLRALLARTEEER